MTWEKFKAMPFQKKLEHIWEYYRWQILVAVVVAFALGTWIRGIVTQVDPIMQVEMVNAYGASDGSEAFQDFLEGQGRDYFEDCISLGRNIQLNGPDPSQNLGAAQMLFCTVAAGEPDLIFWDSPKILPALNGSLMDLRELFPGSFLEEHRESLVYADLDPEEAPYPCGIYTERNPWIMEHKYYVNCTVSVPLSCEDKDLAREFILYMLSYEG